MRITKHQCTDVTSRLHLKRELCTLLPERGGNCSLPSSTGWIFIIASREYDSMRSICDFSPSTSLRDPSPTREVSVRFSAERSGVPRLLLPNPPSNWSSRAACFTGRDLTSPLGGSVVNSALSGEGGTLEEADLPSADPGRDLLDRLSFLTCISR